MLGGCSGRKWAQVEVGAAAAVGAVIGLAQSAASHWQTPQPQSALQGPWTWTSLWPRSQTDPDARQRGTEGSDNSRAIGDCTAAVTRCLVAEPNAPAERLQGARSSSCSGWPGVLDTMMVRLYGVYHQHQTSSSCQPSSAAAGTTEKCSKSTAPARVRL